MVDDLRMFCERNLNRKWYMAVTKILARHARLDLGIKYILNGDKTEEHTLTAHLNCDPGRECREMLDTKRAYGKLDGVQYYHIIQSFAPGEVSPELALEIATEFARDHLPGYETVIAVHVDRQHIHAHLIFNSVNADTGEKYHSNTQTYYQQIRATSDRLCREHGLSVVMTGQPCHAVSYAEWLRQSKGRPTFRSMLEADLRDAIDSANDLGHFYLLMEHMGYEIYHGNRLGFRLRGQERFMYPGRRNGLFTEEGIRAAIEGNLAAIETGQRLSAVRRPAYRPYKKHPKYTGIMALYVHYLYVLGKAGQRQYPPKVTPRLRQEVMKAERYRAQLAFLRENEISTQEEMTAFEARTQDVLADLTKQRTILNVRKKRRKKLYDALADVEALSPAARLYGEGLSGMEAEFARYMDALDTLERCPIPRERLLAEKADIYQQLAEVNREIRAGRKKLALCREIQESLPQMEQAIQKIETKNEVIRDEYRRR